MRNVDDESPTSHRLQLLQVAEKGEVGLGCENGKARAPVDPVGFPTVGEDRAVGAYAADRDARGDQRDGAVNGKRYRDAGIAAQKFAQVGAIILDVEGRFGQAQFPPGEQGLAVKGEEAVAGGQAQALQAVEKDEMPEIVEPEVAEPPFDQLPYRLAIGVPLVIEEDKREIPDDLLLPLAQAAAETVETLDVAGGQRNQQLVDARIAENMGVAQVADAPG
jgi:hypothetical protein